MSLIQVSPHSLQPHVWLTILARNHSFLSIHQSSQEDQAWRLHLNLHYSCDFLACVCTPCCPFDYLLQNLEELSAFLHAKVTFASEDLDMKDKKKGRAVIAAGCFCSYISLVLLNMSQFIQTVLLLLILKLLSPSIWMPPTQNGPDLLELTAKGHQNKGTWHGGGIKLLTTLWSKASRFLFMSRLKRFRNTWKRCSGERGS